MCYIVIVPKNLSKFHMTYTVEGTYTSKAKLQAGISERKGRGINLPPSTVPSKKHTSCIPSRDSTGIAE